MCTKHSVRHGLGALAMSSTIFVSASSVGADVGQWKFKNKTGATAQDLHLTWEGNVTWPGSGVPPQQPANAFAAAHGNGSSSVGLAQGFTGNGVPSVSDVIIDFQYTGDKPVLTAAWWTFTNSTTEMEIPGMPAPVRLQTVNGKINEWAMTPATGDGVLAVTIDNTFSVFQTMPGDDGIESASRFANFISSLPFGDVLQVAGNQVSYTGLSYSDDLPNLAVQILQQDSTQPVTISTVPEPFNASLCAIAAMLLRRRRKD